MKIAIVDDDLAIRELIKSHLKKQGNHCQTFATAIEFLTAVDKNNYDLIITDISMPQITGLELLYWLKHYHPSTPTIVMTAYPSVDIESISKAGGATIFIKKPFSLKNLERSIRLLFSKKLAGHISGLEISDCLQVISCSSDERFFKLQGNEPDSSIFMSLKNSEIVRLQYLEKGLVKKIGEQVFEAIPHIYKGTVTLTELPQHEQDEKDNGTRLPVASVNLLLAQYQDENQKNTLNAQVVYVSGQHAGVPLLQQILKNMGFEITTNPVWSDLNILWEPNLADVHILNPTKIPTVVCSEKETKNLFQSTDISDIVEVNFKDIKDWKQYMERFKSLRVTGVFEDISIFDLIQLTAQSRLSRSFEIKNILEQQTGRLCFLRGQLIEAFYEDEIGESALSKCLQIRVGTIHEMPYEEPATKSLQEASETRLLMNAFKPSLLENSFIEKIDHLLAAK